MTGVQRMLLFAACLVAIIIAPWTAVDVLAALGIGVAGLSGDRKRLGR